MDVQMGEGHDAAHPRKRSGWRGEADPLFAGVSEPICGTEPMLKDGPIPRFLHGFIEYAAGVLVVAPFLLGFESGAAVAVAILAGIAVLFLAAATEGPTSHQLRALAAHVVLDYVLGGLLIAMPFIAGFSRTRPRPPLIALGVLHLLVTIEPGRQRRAEPTAPQPRPPESPATHPRARPASHPAVAALVAAIPPISTASSAAAPSLTCC